MPDFAPRWRRALAGAPILRGHWGALIFAFMGGMWADKIEAVDRATSLTGDVLVWWPTDYAWAAAAIVFTGLGKLALDMYGRNAWLTHAPPGVTWNGLTRDDCNRVPFLRWPKWLTFNVGRNG